MLSPRRRRWVPVQPRRRQRSRLSLPAVASPCSLFPRFPPLSLSLSFSRRLPHLNKRSPRAGPAQPWCRDCPGWQRSRGSANTEDAEPQLPLLNGLAASERAWPFALALSSLALGCVFDLHTVGRGAGLAARREGCAPAALSAAAPLVHIEVYFSTLAKPGQC